MKMAPVPMASSVEAVFVAITVPLLFAEKGVAPFVHRSSFPVKEIADPALVLRAIGLMVCRDNVLPAVTSDAIVTVPAVLLLTRIALAVTLPASVTLIGTLIKEMLPEPPELICSATPLVALSAVMDPPVHVRLLVPPPMDNPTEVLPKVTLTVPTVVVPVTPAPTRMPEL